MSPEVTKSHSTQDAVDRARRLLAVEDGHLGYHPLVIEDAQALVNLYEQLQALQTAAQRILEAPKGTSHSQFRFWLMDALGDATPASTSGARGEGEDA